MKSGIPKKKKTTETSYSCVEDTKAWLVLEGREKGILIESASFTSLRGKTQMALDEILSLTMDGSEAIIPAIRHTTQYNVPAMRLSSD